MKILKSIRDLHSDLTDVALKVSEDVDNILKDYVAAQNWLFKARCKEIISFAQKIETGMYSTPDSIDDFYGCEIVTPNLKEIATAKAFIYENFNVTGEKPNKAAPSDRFTFDGIRIYAKLKEGVAGPKHYSWMRFEIQIKTLLEKAWGTATHDFTYKCKKIDWGRERLTYQLRAILNHADIIISEADSMSKYCNTPLGSLEYTRINNISEWILQTWDRASCPENMKRLSETINKICTTYSLEPEELKSIVDTHRADSTSHENLSIYSFIIQALINSNNDKFWKTATKENKSKGHKIIIFPELEIPDSLLQKIHTTRFVLFKRISSAVPQH